MKVEDLDAIAYTRGPGMQGCLLYCATAAKALAAAHGIPLLGIHHMVSLPRALDRYSHSSSASSCSHTGLDGNARAKIPISRPPRLGRTYAACPRQIAT